MTVCAFCGCRILRHSVSVGHSFMHPHCAEEMRFPLEDRTLEAMRESDWDERQQENMRAFDRQ